LPDGVRFATRAIEGDAPPVFPDEEIAVAKALDRRRRPFAFGRACAREVLGRDVAIPMGPDRQPIWPPGFIGSITHTDEHAAAVAIEDPEFRSIGIDLESLAHAARTPDLLVAVTTPTERAVFGRSMKPERLAAIVFSAKESVYKCLFPVIGVFLDFQDVELSFAGATFVACANGSDIVVRGRLALDDTHVATVAIC
jgi:4'-phosphopantetheinyl transferase EntD